MPIGFALLVTADEQGMDWFMQVIEQPLEAFRDAVQALDVYRLKQNPQAEQTDPPGITALLLAGKSRHELDAILLLLRFGFIQETGPHVRLAFENLVNAALISGKPNEFDELFLDFRFVQQREFARRAGLPLDPETQAHFDEVKEKYTDDKGRLFNDWTGSNWHDKAAALGENFRRFYLRLYTRTSGFSHSGPNYLFDWHHSFADFQVNDPLPLAGAAEVMVASLEIYYWHIKTLCRIFGWSCDGLDDELTNGIAKVHAAFEGLIPTMEEMKAEWHAKFGEDYPMPDFDAEE